MQKWLARILLDSKAIFPQVMLYTITIKPMFVVTEKNYMEEVSLRGKRARVDSQSKLIKWCYLTNPLLHL